MTKKAPPVPTGELHWFCVQTRSRHEKSVAADAARAGIEAYLPFTTHSRVWGGRAVVVELPVFPGYVFLRFRDAAEDRARVVRTHGVVRVVGNGLEIYPVPNEQIDAVRLMMSQPSVRRHVVSAAAPGDWVRVRRGALRGVEGTVERLKGDARLIVRVALIGQAVSAEIDLEAVEVVNARSAA